MKKILLIALCCLLLLITGTASANGWGLRGGIYDIVTQDDAYAGYTATADDGNFYDDFHGAHVNHAILTNRYHSQLICARRVAGRWMADTVSTTAVYQPDSDHGGAALEHQDGSLILSYDDGKERYTFHWSSVYDDYVLDSVYYHADSLYGSSILYENVDDLYDQYRGYILWQGGPSDRFGSIGDSLWYNDYITLSEFNINLMPRTLQEGRQIFSVGSMLRGRYPWFNEGKTLWSLGMGRETLPGTKAGDTLPVYSGPSADTWRAAKGKASVSTAEDIELLGEYRGWTMVSYQVSNRTSRIGFVKGNLMEEPVPLPFDESILLNVVTDTYLTDDPGVSQYAQVRIPAGSQVQGLTSWGPYYAYVIYEQSGQTFWGFVPLKDLSSPHWEQDETQTTPIDTTIAYRWDVSDCLVGKWDLQEGPATSPRRMVLESVGGYDFRTERFRDSVVESGRFRITDCPADSPYAGRALYEIRFNTEISQLTVCGLNLNEDGTITLFFEEGDAVYYRNEYSTYGNG